MNHNNICFCYSLAIFLLLSVGEAVHQYNDELMLLTTESSQRTTGNLRAINAQIGSSYGNVRNAVSFLKKPPCANGCNGNNDNYAALASPQQPSTSPAPPTGGPGSNNTAPGPPGPPGSNNTAPGPPGANTTAANPPGTPAPPTNSTTTAAPPRNSSTTTTTSAPSTTASSSSSTAVTVPTITINTTAVQVPIITFNTAPANTIYYYIYPQYTQWWYGPLYQFYFFQRPSLIFYSWLGLGYGFFI